MQPNVFFETETDRRLAKLEREVWELKSGSRVNQWGNEGLKDLFKTPPSPPPKTPRSNLWMPKSTAPQDGRWFLAFTCSTPWANGRGFFPERFAVLRYNADDEAYQDDDQWELEFDWWMEIPPPPATIASPEEQYGYGGTPYGKS